MHEPVIATDAGLRPTRVVVDLGAIGRNLERIRARVAPAQVMAVVKANAYGHGLVPVARHLESLGVERFGVAYMEEGRLLRRSGVRAQILVMGGILGDQIPAFLDDDLEICASSVAKLGAIDAAAEARGVRARVHLKVDTGMERIGVHWYSAESLLEQALRCRHVDVVGIFSHLANADALDLGHARVQLERFAEVCAFFERRGLPMPLRHIANSGAVLQLPEACLDLVRPGIALYGVRPSTEVVSTLELEPALSWHSRVVFFKVVRAGNPVSYGSTWAPAADTRVLTLPVGYGDGYFRALSNRAQVLVGGARRPVVGRVCMDQVMVDLGRGEAYNGDDVVLLGASGDDRVRVEELAEWAGTIPYEILTNINTRVPRVYVQT